MAIQTTTFKGARYLVKFHDPIEWASTESYEAIEAVQYEAFTYISKQPVPVGVQIDNEDFWLLWADPNAQMEQLRELVSGYVDDVETLSGVVDGISTGLETEIENRKLDIEKAHVFETVADMKQNANLSVGAICHTNGFHTSGDGGAAWYEITDTGTANEMDVIACGELFATLISKPTLVVLGAVNNADCSNFLTRLVELSTGIVETGNGTFVLSENRFDNLENVIIDFCESNVTFTDEGENAYNMTFFEGVNVTVKNGNFARLGNATNGYYAGAFIFSKCNDIKIENCTFEGFTSGGCIKFVRDTGKVEIANCSFDTVKSWGILALNAGAIELNVTNCTFEKFKAANSDYYYPYPVAITYDEYSETKTIAEKLLVENCSFDDCDWEAMDSHGCKNVIYRNNHVHNAQRFFIAYMDQRVKSDKYKCRILIENNTFENDANYVSLRSAIESCVMAYGRYGRVIEQLIIKNNTFENPIAETNALFYFYNIKHMLFEGNSVNIANGSTFRPFYIKMCHRLVFSNNSIIGCNATTNMVLLQSVRGVFENNEFFTDATTTRCINGDGIFSVRVKGNVYNRGQEFAQGILSNHVYSNESILSDQFNRELGQPTTGYNGMRPSVGNVSNFTNLNGVVSSQNLKEIVIANLPEGNYTDGIQLITGQSILVGDTQEYVTEIDFDWGHADGTENIKQIAHVFVRNDLTAGNVTIQPASAVNYQ